MYKAFSNSWNSSKLPRKQRKYRYNAPAHIQGKFMKSPLSKELRKKYNKRNIRVRTGDKVKILRGQYKGKTGKVEAVSTRDVKIFIEKIEIQKKDGSKAKWPINPTNVMIIDLNTEDKRRLSVKGEEATKESEKIKQEKEAPKKNMETDTKKIPTTGEKR